MAVNGNAIIETLNNADEIYNALCQLSPYLYNQSVNNQATLRNLSDKFSQKANVLVAKNEDEVKGLCVFYNNDSENFTAYLSIIVVAADSQGTGLGGVMFQKMLECCRKAGMKKLRLEVDNTNFNALNFYKKRGFVLEKQNEQTSYLICEI